MGNAPLLGRKPSGSPEVKLNALQQKTLSELTAAIQTGELHLKTTNCLSGTSPEETIQVAEVDRYGLPVGAYICPQTGLMWASPTLDSDSAAIFYRDFYRPLYVGKEQATDAFFEDQVMHGREILEFSKLIIGPGGLILDIGCGAGGVLMPFREAGYDTAGCDFGERYLERGKAEGLNLRAGPAEVLADLPKAKMLIASHVFEHVIDPLATLELWSSLVEEGGYLYIEVPGTFHAFDDYRNFQRFLHIAHTYHFTLDSLQALVQRFGFELVDGNESIRALFRKTKAAKQTSTEGIAQQIVRYIETHESPLRKALQPIRRPVMKLRRRLGQVRR